MSEQGGEVEAYSKFIVPLATLDVISQDASCSATALKRWSPCHGSVVFSPVLSTS